jgi:Tn3 transposase DDE domain
MSKATCLSLLSNAALVWNMVQISSIIDQLHASGETITPEELGRISPLAFSHIIPNGTYFARRSSVEHDGKSKRQVNPIDLEIGSDL